MSIYEENLKALAAAYPEMDKLIEKSRKEVKEEFEVIEEEAYDGEMILKVMKDGRICYLSGKRDRTEAAKLWVDMQGTLETNSPVFMMGVGDPSYFLELMKRAEKRIVVILCEPSFQIFLKFLETVPLQKWMKKHTIVFLANGIGNMNENTMYSVFQSIIKYEMIPFTHKLVLPNYEVLFAEETVAFLRVIRNIAHEEQVLYNTKMRFSTMVVKNLLENVKYLRDGYKTTQLVQVIPRDIPGIVVSAGPSLNKNIKELKRAKGRAFIIAVDTAIKPLLAEGIIPDMFAVVDGGKPVDLVKKEEAKDIPLLTGISSNCELLKYHTGMKFFYNEGYVLAEDIMLQSKEAYGGVDTGGSVATNAFSLLYKIGLTHIILVGQDLAYTDNRSHADGTFADVMKEENTKNFVRVEGNLEETVPTTLTLKTYLDWYNNYIKGIMEINPNFRVINATEGGAKIKNTEIMSLHDAIEQECRKEVDIQECLSRLKPMLSEEKRKWAGEFLKEIPELFGRLAEDAKKTKRLYIKLDKICDKKNIDLKEYTSILKKIGKCIKKIEGNRIYQLVTLTMVNAQYILSNEQFLHEDTVQEEGKELARKGILYTENVAKMAQLFQEYGEEVYGEDFV